VPKRPGSDGPSAGEPDPLDNIPPLDLPGDVPRSSATPPVPPAAAPATEAGGKTAGTKPDSKSETPAPEASDLELTSITLPAPEPANIGPGLARFVAVDLKLAGGSLPSAAALDWLVEKGYRTLLDLRETSEVSPAFIADVTKRGLRYIALPIGPGSIDREHVTRFGFEVAAGEARPLYFFDSDGTRSGALWYIRRIATDRVDQQVARREAEELGLSDLKYWSAVTKYVSTLPQERTTSTSDNTHGNATSSAVAFAAPSDAAGPKAAMTNPREPETKPAGAQPSPAPAEQGAPSVLPTLEPTEPTDEDRPPVDAALPGNPMAWRTFTVMVVTCVGLPLAYWGRNLSPANRARIRASLPGPARQP
jgi:protein tyrosine phosphatase (PTP) superfamily phosphohydrolase (DUF442 family)